MHTMTMLMQLQLEHFHLMSHLLWILRRCFHIKKKPCHLHCIYQYHLRTHYTFIGIFAPMFWLPTKQFLLLIDVPIQDQSQQLSIYKIFTLDIPHGNFTAHYDINTQYLGITQDETMAVELSPHQFSICQEANGQFCNIITPFQLLANPPSFITTLYTKTTANISARCSLKIRQSHSVSIPLQIVPNVWI